MNQPQYHAVAYPHADIDTINNQAAVLIARKPRSPHMESTNLVGVHEAARRLARNPSIVSRPIATGIIPNHGRVNAPLVDVEEARAARAGHLDRSKQHEPEAPLYTGDAPAAAAPYRAGRGCERRR